MKKLQLIVSLLFVISIAATTVAQNAAPLKMIDFVLTPDAANWNYKTDQNARVQVSVYRFGVPVSNATINYEIGPEQLPAEKNDCRFWDLEIYRKFQTGANPKIPKSQNQKS